MVDAGILRPEGETSDAVSNGADAPTALSLQARAFGDIGCAFAGATYPFLERLRRNLLASAHASRPLFGCLQSRRMIGPPPPTLRIANVFPDDHGENILCQHDRRRRAHARIGRSAGAARTSTKAPRRTGGSEGDRFLPPRIRRRDVRLIASVTLGIKFLPRDGAAFKRLDRVCFERKSGHSFSLRAADASKAHRRPTCRQQSSQMER
ncbi:MAG: hypothetical protein ACR65Z_09130 [Methylocystis sp.]|jgi:hypothetical protein